MTKVLVYSTWNPSSYNFLHYIIMSSAPFSTRALLAVTLIAIYAFYLHETFQSFNWYGVVIFFGLIAVVIWKAVDWGLMGLNDINLWAWIAPAILSTFFTVGLLGPRMLRWATGRVPVSVNAQSDQPQDHHIAPHH